MNSRALLLKTVCLSFLLLNYVVDAYDYSTVTEHCASLWNYTLDPGYEAPMTVTNVTLIPAHNSIPAYCRVTGMVAQYTGVLILLPAYGEDWKGIYSAEGCGGSCGSYAYLDSPSGLSRGPIGESVIQQGYVSSATDMGHQNAANENSGSQNQFVNNRTVLNNWSFLSTHYLSVTGKAMAEYYYGVPPKYSFFRGGSTGGRQGMILAQRYPHDFDAIVVGYAAFNKTGQPCTQFAYLALATQYTNGTLILNTTDQDILHEGALAECDANDGLVDGIIDPSYKCIFDPLSIYCPVGQTPSGRCLSSMDKVTAAKKVYSYLHDSNGHLIYNSRYHPGSEAEWTITGGGSWSSLATNNNRAVCYQRTKPTNWTLNDFDFDVDPYQMGYMADIMSPLSLDLSAFSAKGGKIIHYQGMADGGLSLDWNLNYYKGMLAANGGLEATQTWYRFFLYPGMGHVDYGEKYTVAHYSNYYAYLENWLEKGIAPKSLEVERVTIATNTTLGKRLYFPWPLVPKFIGKNLTGTDDDLKNWVGVRVPKRLQGPGLETYPY